MQIFLATLIAVTLAFLGMALGVLTGRRKPSCACKTAAALTSPDAVGQGPPPTASAGAQLTVLSTNCGHCEGTTCRSEHQP